MALVTKNFSDIITFTRASTATYFDATGTLQSAAINTPRLDYNPATLAAQGLLIEEQRTNSIRNNTMQGAVAGTPGTAPTNWFIGGLSGLTQQIVGTGTEGGINYIDVRISGTTTSALFYVIRPESAVFVAATNGQTWTSAQYVRLVGGSLANLTQVNNVIQYSDAGGVPLTYGIGGITPTGAALNTQRFVRTTTAVNASTAFVVNYVQLEANSGVAIDITLRIGLPQLEQGAFATSVIPTTTTALTRSADVASVNTLSPWFNATASTIYGEWTNLAATMPTGSVQTVARLGDTTGNNLLALFQIQGASTKASQNMLSGGANPGRLDAGGAYSNATVKAAAAFAASDRALAVNGGVAVTSATGAMPLAQTRMGIGMDDGFFNILNGWLRRITYYPRRLSNAELQALTV